MSHNIIEVLSMKRLNLHLFPTLWEEVHEVENNLCFYLGIDKFSYIDRYIE